MSFASFPEKRSVGLGAVRRPAQHAVSEGTKESLVSRGVGAVPGMMHIVAAGETPMRIAVKYTGNPARYAELLSVNMHKPRVNAGGQITFKALAVGERLNLPINWMNPPQPPQIPWQPNLTIAAQALVTGQAPFPTPAGYFNTCAKGAGVVQAFQAAYNASGLAGTRGRTYQPWPGPLAIDSEYGPRTASALLYVWWHIAGTTQVPQPCPQWTPGPTPPGQWIASTLTPLPVSMELAGAPADPVPAGISMMNNYAWSQINRNGVWWGCAFPIACPQAIYENMPNPCPTYYFTWQPFYVAQPMLASRR